MPKPYKEEFKVGDFVKLNPKKLEEICEGDSELKNYSYKLLKIVKIIPDKHFCYVLEDVPYVFSADELIASQSLITDKDLENRMDRVKEVYDELEINADAMYEHDGHTFGSAYGLADYLFGKYDEEKTIEILCEFMDSLSHEANAYMVALYNVAKSLEDLDKNLGSDY